MRGGGAGGRGFVSRLCAPASAHTPVAAFLQAVGGASRVDGRMLLLGWTRNQPCVHVRAQRLHRHAAPSLPLPAAP